MEGMDREILLVGRCGVVAMGDVEDIIGDILFNDKPGAT